MILALSEMSISATENTWIKMFEGVKIAYSPTFRAKPAYVDDA